MAAISGMGGKVSMTDPADIAVIGGGPVGLWTAIQTKLLTGKDVVVAEKYDTYKRTHTLGIDISSLSPAVQSPDLEALRKKWGGRFVPIQEIESELLRIAHKVGVRVLRGTEIKPKEAKKIFPNAKVLIGADGARSNVRKDIFGGQLLFHHALEYMVQAKYYISREDVFEFGSSIKAIQRYYEHRFAGHYVIQSAKPQKDGSELVTLLAFVDKATYDKVKDATFKHPYTFSKDLDRLPDGLKSLFQKWWGLRSLSDGEDIIASPKNKLTAVALNAYAAKNVVKQDGNRVWVLVGDAAAGYPFRRAINNGFLLGSELARNIARGFKKTTGKKFSASHLEAYSWYSYFRVKIEEFAALVKSAFLSLYRTIVAFRMPKCCSCCNFKFRMFAEREARGKKIWEYLRNTPTVAKPKELSA
jgi:2-polyprenyl-6-methoxyphenol hydroxylase-like FAD-dependent oxidoreductase